MELPMGLGCWEGCINFVDRDGAIHLFGMRFLKWPEDRERPELHEQRTDVYHIVSRDGGAMWEGPARLDYGEEFTAAIMNVAHLLQRPDRAAAGVLRCRAGRGEICLQVVLLGRWRDARGGMTPPTFPSSPVVSTVTPGRSSRW